MTLLAHLPLTNAMPAAALKAHLDSVACAVCGRPVVVASAARYTPLGVVCSTACEAADWCEHCPSDPLLPCGICGRAAK